MVLRDVLVLLAWGLAVGLAASFGYFPAFMGGQRRWAPMIR
jgi:hypothetical protein